MKRYVPVSPEKMATKMKRRTNKAGRGMPLSPATLSPKAKQQKPASPASVRDDLLSKVRAKN